MAPPDEERLERRLKVYAHVMPGDDEAAAVWADELLFR